MSEQAPLPVSLYLHVPFCVSKCAYCDFHSEGGREALFSPFVDAAVFEAGHWSHHGLLDDVETVYVGGGTPSLLGGDLVRLVADILEIAETSADAEVTVEANPDSLTLGLARELAGEGVTRVSVGVQSLDAHVLAVLGRCHDKGRASDALDAVVHAGLRLSADLICGVPGQTTASWRATLREVAERGAAHVSVYPLTVEEGTTLEHRVATGAMQAPDPDEAAEMMVLAEEVLGEAGLLRYETANFARPGEESRHNLGYWTGRPYIGIGPSAASMLPAEPFADVASTEGWLRRSRVPAAPEDAARVRFTRAHDTLAFLRSPIGPPEETEYLSADQARREDVMLGLRLTRGISEPQAAEAGLAEVLASLETDGLVERYCAEREARWRTTRRGWLLGNEVFGRIWSGP